MTYERELSAAKEAAVLAGKHILSIYHDQYDIEMKANETPVTRADLEANRLIVDLLKKSFPSYSLLSEECSDDLSRLENPYCWIIDPLDGTKEFIKKNDEFAVNIALSAFGEIVVGVVYAPVFDELYFASKDQGAYITYWDAARSQYITEKTRVSERCESLKALKSRSHENPRYAAILKTHQNRIVKTKNVGSSYKGCLIAKGDYDVYYSFGTTSIWDIAPLEVILKESGGFMAQGDGSPFEYNVANTSNNKGFMILNSEKNRLSDEVSGYKALE